MLWKLSRISRSCAGCSLASGSALAPPPPPGVPGLLRNAPREAVGPPLSRGGVWSRLGEPVRARSGDQMTLRDVGLALLSVEAGEAGAGDDAAKSCVATPGLLSSSPRGVSGAEGPVSRAGVCWRLVVPARLPPGENVVDLAAEGLPLRNTGLAGEASEGEEPATSLGMTGSLPAAATPGGDAGVWPLRGDLGAGDGDCVRERRPGSGVGEPSRMELWRRKGETRSRSRGWGEAGREKGALLLVALAGEV